MQLENATRRRTRGLQLLIGIAIPLLVLVVTTNSAIAHCWPIEQFPGAGAVLDEAPAMVRIRFNQPIQVGASRVFVDQIGGARIQTSPSSSPQTEADVLVVSLPKLTPGRYRVHWTAVTLDGHESHGDYSFDFQENQVEADLTTPPTPPTRKQGSRVREALFDRPSSP